MKYFTARMTNENARSQVLDVQHSYTAHHRQFNLKNRHEWRQNSNRLFLGTVSRSSCMMFVYRKVKGPLHSSPVFHLSINRSIFPWAVWYLRQPFICYHPRYKGFCRKRGHPPSMNRLCGTRVRKLKSKTTWTWLSSVSEYITGLDLLAWKTLL